MQTTTVTLTLTLNLGILKPNSINFDRVTTTTILCQVSSHSNNFLFSFYRATYTPTHHPHIVTKWSQYPRRAVLHCGRGLTMHARIQTAERNSLSKLLTYT